MGFLFSYSAIHSSLENVLIHVFSAYVCLVICWSVGVSLSVCLTQFHLSVFVCVSIFVSVSVFVRLSTCLFILLSLSVCLCLLFLCLSLRPCLRVSASLLIFLPVPFSHFLQATSALSRHRSAVLGKCILNGVESEGRLTPLTQPSCRWQQLVPLAAAPPLTLAHPPGLFLLAVIYLSGSWHLLFPCLHPLLCLSGWRFSLN